jgi:hypothetical protein
MTSGLLRELARWWSEINEGQFEGAMRPPSLLVDARSRRMGCWERQARTLHLSARLIEHHPWREVIEVLRHEMAHQYVDEVLGVHDETAHGPAFRAVCEARSIDGRAVGGLTEDPAASAVMRRVEALMALAGSDNEFEAKAAMGTAHRLMRKHNIAAAGCPSHDAFSFMQLGTVRRRNPAHEKILAGILGAHFFVQPIWVEAFDGASGTRGRTLEVCGRPENLIIAQHVHSYMLETCERLWVSHKKNNGITNNRDRRRFLQGVMVGFHEQLKDDAEVCEETGLVWMGDAGLEQWVSRRFPHLRSGRRTRMRTNGAWAAGRVAGQNVVWRKPLEATGRGIRGLLGIS